MESSKIAKNTPLSTTQAISRLLAGAVGVMPTDTVYGVVAQTTDKTAVERLYTLKHRERKPGTIVAANLEQLRQLGVSEEYLEKAGQWWPNALSIILPLSEEFAYLHQGVGDIAIRVVIDEKFKQILEQTGPLLTSSANRPGEPGSTTITEAWNYFEDSVDFYIDGGDLSGRAPSTIIRLTATGEPQLIRAGAVKI